MYANIVNITDYFDVKETTVVDFSNRYVFIDVNKQSRGIYSVVDHSDFYMKIYKPEEDEDLQVVFNGKHLKVNLISSDQSERITWL